MERFIGRAVVHGWSAENFGNGTVKLTLCHKGYVSYRDIYIDVRSGDVEIATNGRCIVVCYARARR